MQPSRSYNHETAAEALFFKNTVNGTVHQAIRVEVPELGIEYTDNAYIGKGVFSSNYMRLRYLMVFFFGFMKTLKAYSTMMEPQT
jgi:hypothetical protein